MERKRNDDQINSDRKFIISLLRKGGLTQAEITERVNNRYFKNKIDIVLSQESIRLDIKAIRKALQKDFEDDLESLKAESILKINETKKQALIDYRKSFGDDIKTIEKIGSNDKIGAYQENITERTKLRGNPKYLDIVLKCDIEINKLMGLYDKKEDSINVNTLSSLSDEELEAQINALNNES